METEGIVSLVNLGSAGAVIAVVIIFLKYIRERDAEWRSFFTDLTKTQAADAESMTHAMRDLAAKIECIGRDLTAHDSKVDDRLRQAQATARARQARKQAAD